MPYSDFQLSFANISFRAEIDFGSGWENISALIKSVSIVEYSMNIAGLIEREIQIRVSFDDLQADLKWTETNLPVRLFVSANGFEELVFNGLTVGGASITDREIELNIVDSTSPNLHTSFGSDTLDRVIDTTFEANIITTPERYYNDGFFLKSGTFDEDGSNLTNLNFRPKPIVSNDQTVRCNALFNYTMTPGLSVGYYTVNEMLKALGCLINTIQASEKLLIIMLLILLM